MGDLGPGEHQTLVVDNRVYVTSLIADESNTSFEKRILRVFDFERMRVEREIDLPLEASWKVVGARGDIVVGRTESVDGEPQLVCMELDHQTERWRIPIPKSVKTSPALWVDESKLVLAASTHGMIRPFLVELETGAWEPDRSWQDPRLVLTWYQEGALYPDFVTVNEKFTVGRWRYLQLVCVNTTTGQLIWNHNAGEFQIGSVYGMESRLGDYIIAESRDGFVGRLGDTSVPIRADCFDRAVRLRSRQCQGVR